MRLIYIWLEDFKCFKDTELNFSDGNRFNYDKKTGYFTKRKDCQNENLFQLLEVYPMIDNISAIVGSNGSGKTSICELFYSIFYLGKIDIPHIIIYDQDDVLYIHKQDDMLYENHTGLEINDYSYNNNIYFIYYSPFYSPMHVMQTLGCPDNSTFHDISTSALLQSDKLYYENQKTLVEYERNISHLEANKISDFHRIIKFLVKVLQNQTEFKLGITIPQKYIFSIDENDKKAFENEFKDNNDIFQIYQSILDRINFLEHKTIVNKILVSIFCNFARSSLNSKQFDLNYEVVNEYITRIKYVYNNNTKDDIITLLKKIFYELDSEKNRTNILFSLQRTQTSAIVEMLGFLFSLPESILKENSIQFDINQNINELLQFQRLYELTKKSTEYGIFTPDPYLSSGEYSEILFYSRLYEKMNEIIKRNDNKNIILFLDEIEVTLHPKLQQGMIQNLVNFFSIFFNNQQFHIQIIIATHSPIILSDLPSSNVVFLKKDPPEKESKVIDDYSIKTFGSNIYNLYKDSFFIDETLMGLFAKNQINNAIKEVNQKYITKKSISSLSKYIISQIGEPVLRKMIEARIISNDTNTSE